VANHSISLTSSPHLGSVCQLWRVCSVSDIISIVSLHLIRDNPLDLDMVNLLLFFYIRITI